MAETLRFYFDYLSPYAYLAWKRVHGVVEPHGIEVEPVPVLLAALLDHHGNVGPAEVPAKRLYVFKHLLRLAHELDLPLEPPPTHPFNPLPALRLSCLDMPAPTRRALVDALFDRVWAGGGGVEDIPGLVEVAASLDIEDPLGRAQAPQNKLRLRAHTEEAVAAGVFGVPALVVAGEMFWGLDSLKHLDAFLGGKDPLDSVLLQRWADLPASARRT